MTAPAYKVEPLAGAQNREALKLVHRANDAIEAGNMALATQHWRHAWKLAPDDPTVKYCRGVEALYSHRFAESLTYLRWACNSRWYRDQPQAHFHLGCAYRGAGDFRGAARALRHTLALDPKHMGAMIQRGFLLQMHGDHAQAEALFAKAVTLEHRTPSDRNDLATLSAWRGDYSHWSLFENRWRIGLRHQTTALQEILGTHRWNGKSFPGTLMLEAEQGQGDVLMMARYTKLAAAMVDKLVLVVQPSLVSLMLRLGFDVYGTDEPLPHFDAHSPMMSLPWLMGTDTLAKVPPPADFGIPRAPTDRLHAPRAGLVWAGSNVAALDKDRSAAVRAFAPLLDLPGITWHSLQRGNREDEYDLPQLARGDWLQTAHEIATLDFVVSVDTAVAHLAGSLGVPTYLFPPTYFEFRHNSPQALVANGYAADASVWYPGHRLIRRQHTSDWPAAVEQLRARLEAR